MDSNPYIMVCSEEREGKEAFQCGSALVGWLAWLGLAIMEDISTYVCRNLWLNQVVRDNFFHSRIDLYPFHR